MLSKPRTSARRYEHPSVTGAAHAGLSLMSQYKVWLPSTKPHDTEEDRARAAAHAAHAYAARDREYRERSDRDRAAERDRARRDRDREQREQELQLARHQERERQRAVERDRLRAAHSAAATATAATTSQQRSDAPLRPQPTSRPSYTTTATTATTSTTTTSSSANPSSSSHPQQQQQQQWHPGWAGPGQHPSHSSLSSVGSHIYSTAPTSVSSSLMSMSAKPAQRPSLADTSAVQSGSWRSSADRATVDRAEEDRLRAATVTRMAAAGSSTSLASADSGSANAPSHSRTDLKSAPHWFSGPSQQPPSASNAYGSRSTEIQLPGDGSRRPSVDKQSRRDDPRKANGYLSDLTETEAKTPRARSPIPPSLPFPANGQERGFKPAPSQPAPTQLVPPPVPSRGVSPTPTTGSRYESRSRADSQIEGTVSRPASAWSQYAASVSLNKALPAEDEVVVQKLQRSSSASVGQPPVHAYAQHGLAEPMTMPGPTRRSTYSGQPSRDSQTSTYGTPTSLTTASASMTQHMNNSRTSLNSAAPPAAFSPQLVAISRVPSTSAFVPTPAPISRVPSNSTFTPTPASMSRVPPNNTFVPTGASVSRVPSHNALPPPPVTMTRVPSSSTFVPTPAPNNAAHAPDLAQLRSPTQVPLQMSAFQSPAATRPSTALSGTYASSRMPISYTTAPITSVLASAMQSAQPHGANTRSTWSTHPGTASAHGHTAPPPALTPSPTPGAGPRSQSSAAPVVAQPSATTSSNAQYQAAFLDTAYLPGKSRTSTLQLTDDPRPASSSDEPPAVLPRASTSTSLHTRSRPHGHLHSHSASAIPPQLAPAPETKKRSAASGFFNYFLKPKKYEIWDPITHRGKEERRKSADGRASDRETDKDKKESPSRLSKSRSASSSAQPEPPANVLRKELQAPPTSSSHRRVPSSGQSRDVAAERKESSSAVPRSHSAHPVRIVPTVAQASDPIMVASRSHSRSHSNRESPTAQLTSDAKSMGHPAIYRASTARPSQPVAAPRRSAMVPGEVSDRERVREEERLRERTMMVPSMPIAIPSSGRKSPLHKLPFKLMSAKRRTRTMSTASLDVLDGDAPNTVLNSPASSVRSPTPTASPPVRDPQNATAQWRDQEEQELRDSGRIRRRRPGVTFDVCFEDSPMAGDRPRTRSKMKGTPRMSSQSLPDQLNTDNSSDDDD